MNDKPYKEIDNYKKMQGKTIALVTPCLTWRKDEVEELLIAFTDGSSIRINALQEAGCNECDSDGSTSGYFTSHFVDGE